MLLIFRRLIFYSEYPMHSFQTCAYCYVDFLPVFGLFRPFTTCFT